MRTTAETITVGDLFERLPPEKALASIEWLSLP
jgi:hypothetical protein